MRLLYLGTAAAEGIPALFCHCPRCEEARALGGREIRTRAQALVDGKLLLDFGPDTYLHCLAHPQSFDLARVEALLITHSHHDHFIPEDIGMRCTPFGDAASMLHLYGNEAVEAKYRAVEADSEHLRDVCVFHPARPFEPFTAAGYTVTPLRAVHAPQETCLIYLVSDGEKTLLYGHDTGIFSEDTWACLKGKHVDLVSLDCTCQSTPDGANHMGLRDADVVRRRLLEQGTADADTLFVVNHFSHNGGWNHETTEREANACSMTAAYDGRLVTV